MAETPTTPPATPVPPSAGTPTANGNPPQPNSDGTAANPVGIDHNVRIVTFLNGDAIITNFTQVIEQEKFVAYQCLFPLLITLTNGDPQAEEETFNVSYRRWNPFTPFEDHRINPQSVVSAMPPAKDIIMNYVMKLKDAGVDLSFLPNNGNDILGITDGQQEPTGATTEGPVATGTGGGS